MFHWELRKGAVTIISHWAERVYVHLALLGTWRVLVRMRRSGKLCGLCLFLHPWLKASAGATWRVKTSILSKGDDVSRGKNHLVCSSPPAQLWPLLLTGSSLVLVCASYQSQGEAGTEGCCHSLWEKATLQRGLPWAEWGIRHQCNQSLEESGKCQVGFSVCEGCWDWEEIESPVIWMFSVL